MVVHLAALIKMGEGVDRRCRIAAWQSEKPSSTLFPRFPIGDRLDPIIDRVIFRMLRHQLCLPADIREHLRIA
jgi:hypothetical protein